MFEVNNLVIVVTGGTGALGGSVSRCLLDHGAKVVLLGRSKDKVDEVIQSMGGGENLTGYECDVLNQGRLEEVQKLIVAKWGRIDVLINFAGGNVPVATVKDDQTVFDIPYEIHKTGIDLNLDGTIIPSLVFGKAIAESGSGTIINVSSMATFSALSRVMAYSVAKTGINSFTQWMAMEMAVKFGDKIRVNAIAPGFFIGEQNRAALINPDGSLTERSKKVLARTPMRRFGDIEELNGAILFLCSKASSFVTGAIIPVDGGFSSFSGI